MSCIEDHESVLAELSALAAQLAPSDSPEPIVARRLAAASGFSARRIVYLADFAVEQPLIVAVLSGRKEIALEGARWTAERGDVIVFPARVPLSVTSTPDAPDGRFRSFVVEVDPEVSAALTVRHPELCAHGQSGAFDPARPHVLRASAPALQAILHFARSLLVEDTPAALLRHRLEDLLLALSLQHAASRRAVHEGSGEADLVLAVRKLVRQAPEAELSTEIVARKLAVSPATLRRRLAQAGVSLRALRTEERMALARVLLARPGAQVAEVALRCGYRSPSKFARQFRRFAGAAPRQRPS